MFIQRDKQVTLERSLSELLHRVDVLRATGVKFAALQREALAYVVRTLRDSVEQLQQGDPTWKPKR